MEQLSFWQGRRVFLTGHTGFKGTWLTSLLNSLGAEVHGFALDPVGDLNMFDLVEGARFLATDTRADIRDIERLSAALVSSNAEIVIHMAAQALVLEGYRNPLSTFDVNIMGTANVLEACRTISSVRAIVVVTTDKVYEIGESSRPFRETDRLGGHDPYSASKACAELVTAAYGAVYVTSSGQAPNLATARAGNVTGGGDWAADRLIPDCVRAFSAGKSVCLRNPSAVRPWQHVLEPLAGYLELARRLYESPAQVSRESWNFGPGPESNSTVLDVANLVASHWGKGGSIVCLDEPIVISETHVLRLDASKAHEVLSWRDRLSLAENIAMTMSWYRAWREGQDLQATTLHQIKTFLAART